MRSEGALDQALAAIEGQLQHETMPLSQEKKLIAELKKLQAQREKVPILIVITL